jgi:hypothetical protein
MSARETYVDGYEESRAELPLATSNPVDVPGHLHSNEAVSRFVAYAGSYLLWGAMALMTAGLVIFA